jgi:hypothetical protein
VLVVYFDNGDVEDLDIKGLNDNFDEILFKEDFVKNMD